MKLLGKVALITGAGRGVGRRIAVAFGQNGADVGLVARNALELAQTQGEVEKSGTKVRAYPIDITNQDGIRDLVRDMETFWGKIDILVNCAGIQGPIGPLEKNDATAWMQTLAVNLFGVFLCCREVIPGMIKQQRGKIINISGGGATAPRPNFSAYAASKAAVVRLTETLAAEVAPLIQVNAIAPGAVKTRMIQEIIQAGDSAGSEFRDAQRVIEQDDGTASAAVTLAVFLASEESGQITGKLISAVHDPWDTWEGRDQELNASPLYTLKRLDPFTIQPLLRKD